MAKHDRKKDGRTRRGTMDTLYSFRLDKHLRDSFIETCRKNGDTPSQVLRDVMMYYVGVKNSR